MTPEQLSSLAPRFSTLWIKCPRFSSTHARPAAGADEATYSEVTRKKLTIYCCDASFPQILRRNERASDPQAEEVELAVEGIPTAVGRAEDRRTVVPRTAAGDTLMAI
jgi:hypothetical protein